MTVLDDDLRREELKHKERYLAARSKDVRITLLFFNRSEGGLESSRSCLTV